MADDAVSPKNATQEVGSPAIDNGAAGADDHVLTLRSLVSTKEAGIIIGKGGATIASIRTSTGVKAGVSKVVPGVQDRVFSVSGEVESIASAFSEVARLLLETPLSDSSLPPPPVGAFTSVRLLISHNLMGTVIGRQGAKIKQIQDESGARMVASKEMLPQSTERVVEVQGSVDAIKTAILEIAKCLLEDWDRGTGTVQYHPGAAGDAGVLAGGLGAGTVTGPTGGIRRTSVASGFGGSSFPGGDRRQSRTSVSGPTGGLGVPQAANQGLRRPSNDLPPINANDPALSTQTISIPADMVGCIIGRGGAKISEIRRLSGSRVSIAKVPHDETGERMFTIVGNAEQTETALVLIFNQLESEKQRRMSQGVPEEQTA